MKIQVFAEGKTEEKVIERLKQFFFLVVPFRPSIVGEGTTLTGNLSLNSAQI
jgi:predicted RNase H-like HicB family nuclease